MAFRALILILIVVALVTGCGFKLRGQLPLPEQLQVITVQGTDREVREEMIDALRATGAEVVDEGSEAAVLDLYRVEFTRNVRTIDTRGKVTGYVLRYDVSYRVTNPEGEELRSTTMALQRDYNFDPEQVLQAEREEDSLREDMIEELTQRIMRQLVTIAALTIEVPVPGERASA
jgi:LPS-assembly lipoprotein